MLFSSDRHIKALRKRSKRGFAGYPVATLAFYGPTNTLATKLAVGIILIDGGDAEHLKRWFAEDGDVRYDSSVMVQALEFVRSHGAKSVVMADRIIGCPHEEGIDYPEGMACPRCPFWADRDRFARARGGETSTYARLAHRFPAVT